jgi:hypothetical protein
LLHPRQKFGATFLLIGHLQRGIDGLRRSSGAMARTAATSAEARANGGDRVPLEPPERVMFLR